MSIANNMRATFLLLLATTCFAQSIRVNVGGPQYTDSTGDTWLADTGCTSTSTYTYAGTIAGTPDPTIYNTGRTGGSTLNCTYTVGTPGYYLVTLNFAETNNAVTASTTGPGANPRLMNIFIDGTLYVSNLNVRQAAGFATAYSYTSPYIAVTSSTLSITITQTHFQPMLAGITVVPVSLQVTNSGILWDTGMSTLLQACQNAVAAGKTLGITQPWLNTPSTDCSSLAGLVFTGGGLIQTRLGATVIIPAPAASQTQRIFDTTTFGGAVSFTSKPALAYFEWWGAKADDSTNNSATMQAAINTVQGVTAGGPPRFNNAGYIQLLAGKYRFNTELLITSALTINGLNDQSGVLKWTGGATPALSTGNSGRSVYLTYLGWDNIGTGTQAIFVANSFVTINNNTFAPVVGYTDTAIGTLTNGGILHVQITNNYFTSGPAATSSSARCLHLWAGDFEVHNNNCEAFTTDGFTLGNFAGGRQVSGNFTHNYLAPQSGSGAIGSPAVGIHISYGSSMILLQSNRYEMQDSGGDFNHAIVQDNGVMTVIHAENITGSMSYTVQLAADSATSGTVIMEGLGFSSTGTIACLNPNGSTKYVWDHPAHASAGQSICGKDIAGLSGNAYNYYSPLTGLVKTLEPLELTTLTTTETFSTNGINSLSLDNTACKNLTGHAIVTGPASSVAVLFNTTMLDNHYGLILTPDDNATFTTSGTPVYTAIAWPSDQTTAGFTIHLGSAPSFVVGVRWLALCGQDGH